MIRMLLIAASFELLLSSCSHDKSSGEIPRHYNSNISGLFLAEGTIGVCQMEVVVKNSPEIAINKFWRQRDNIKVLLTGINSVEGGTSIIVASPEICSPSGRSSIVAQLSKILHVLQFKEYSPLQILDYDEAYRKLGLREINASNFASGPMKDCKVDRDFRKEMSYEDIVDIRYGMAIPIVFYLHSGDREFIAFDTNCEFRDSFLNLIDKNF